VSIRASEESRVLLWHRDKLKLILLSDAFLQAVFDHILGRDVVRKLTQVGLLLLFKVRLILDDNVSIDSSVASPQRSDDSDADGGDVRAICCRSGEFVQECTAVSSCTRTALDKCKELSKSILMNIGKSLAMNNFK
jgi:hypothetical protein